MHSIQTNSLCVSLLHHVRSRGVLTSLRYLILETPRKRLDVDVQEGVDCLIGDLRKRRGAVDTRVVERHVKRPELLDRGVHHHLAVGFL